MRLKFAMEVFMENTTNDYGFRIARGELLIGNFDVSRARHQTTDKLIREMEAEIPNRTHESA